VREHKKGIFLTAVCLSLFIVFIYLSQGTAALLFVAFLIICSSRADETFLSDDEGSIVEPPPLVLSTWTMIEPVNYAWKIVSNDGPCLDAVEQAINLCEMNPTICNFTGEPRECENVLLMIFAQLDMVLVLTN